jgi:60 kDa SS-A/Ro ribonucleoprotein
MRSNAGKIAGAKGASIRKQTKRDLQDAPTENLAGAPAWDMPTKERFVNMLMCNMLGGTYYASERDLADLAVSTHEEMLKEDPVFYAKAIVYARNAGYVREQPALGLVYLSTLPTKELVYSVFNDVAKIPSDVSKFIEYARKGGIRKGLGSVGKELINRWLRTNLSEYWAIKYPKDLKDAISLTRPKLGDNYIVEHIMGKKASIMDYETQLGWFNALKRGDGTVNPLAAITEGRLPFEVVTSITKMDKDAWETLMPQMPYFALLRNLNTLQRHGVFEKKKNVDYVVARLTDPEAVKKSKLFPFRFYNAYKAFASNSSSGGWDTDRILDALSDAMDIAISNIPEVPGRILIAQDVSGSMSGGSFSRGTTTYSDIAGIFGAVLFKAFPDTRIMQFDTDLYKVNASRKDSVMSLSQSLSRSAGGTTMGLPLKYLNEHDIQVEHVIYVTDNMDWFYDTIYGNYADASDVLTEWRLYRNNVAPTCQLWWLRLDPYGTQQHLPEEPGVHTFNGWSDNVVRTLATKANGMAGQIEQIESVALWKNGDDEGPIIA